MDLFGIKKRKAAQLAKEAEEKSDYALKLFRECKYEYAEKEAYSAAKSGCLEAIDHIIACYVTGESVPQDLYKALVLAEAAVPLGSVWGAHVAADISFYGAKASSTNKEIPANYEAVYKYASISVKEPKYRGLSSYHLAELYANGRYVEKDLNKAFSFYKTASDSGINSATISLARFYRLGYGTDKNEEKCFELLTKADKANPGSANFELGMLHQYSKGKYYSLENAVKYFAKSGSSTAINQLNKVLDAFTEEQLLDLGDKYSIGIGVSKNTEIAYNAYRKALDKNKESRAFRWLIFHDLNENPDSDFVKQVLSEKDSGTLEFIGRCLMSGLNGELNKNEKQAIRFFQTAYEKDKHPDAHYYLVKLLLIHDRNNEFLDSYYDERIANGSSTYREAYIYGCNLIHRGINETHDPDTVIKGINTLIKLTGDKYDTNTWEQIAKGSAYLADTTEAPYWISEARYRYATLSEKSVTAEYFEKFVYYTKLIKDDKTDYITMLTNELISFAEDGFVHEQIFLEEQYRLGNLLPLDPVQSSYWCKKLIDSDIYSDKYTLEYADRLLAGYGVMCDVYEAEKYLSRFIDDALNKYRVIYTASTLLPVWGLDLRIDLILKWANAASKLQEEHAEIKKVFFLWQIWAETPGTYIYTPKANNPELNKKFVHAKLTEIYGQNYYETAELYKQLANAGHGEAAYRLTVIYSIIGTANNTEIAKYLDIAKQLGYPADNSFADYLTRIVSGDVDALGDMAIYLARDDMLFKGRGGQIHKNKYYVAPLVDIGLEHLTTMANKNYPKYKFDLSEFYAYKLRRNEELEEYWENSAFSDSYAPALLAVVDRGRLPYYKQTEYVERAISAGINKAYSYLKRIDMARQVDNHHKADYNKFSSSLRNLDEITRSFELDIAESEFNKQIFGYNETFFQMAENSRIDAGTYLAISRIREKHMDKYRNKLKEQYPNK